MTRDDAVIGEAAGIAMGLVMIGSMSPMAIEDMRNVSHVVYDTSIKKRFPAPPTPPPSSVLWITTLVMITEPSC